MVTDEQMIAATKAYAGIDGKCRPVAMRAALEAALSSPDDAPPAVAVKTLEWTDEEWPRAKCIFGCYVINPDYRMVDLIVGHGGVSEIMLARIELSKYASDADLKAAAQADYEARVRAALVSPADTSPVIPEGWLDISTAPKNMKVLAAYRNENGKWRIITACYHTELPWSDDDDRDDDEAEYAPEGWYEESDSSEVIYPTSSKPTHWQPLPAPPVYVAAPKEASHDD